MTGPVSAAKASARPSLPRSIFGYVWQTDRKNQVFLSLLTVVVFLLSLAPLEFQRRIINGALGARDLGLLVMLCAGYGAAALTMGGLKLALNVFRGYASECATRRLRTLVHAGGAAGTALASPIEIEMVVAEAEPVGGFVGIAYSEPLLQGGVLLSVFGYMLVINPSLAAVSIALFVPQMVFVPLMQRAINRRTHLRIRVMRGLSATIVASHAGAAAQFRRHANRVYELNMQIFRWKFTMNFLMNGLYHLAIVGVYLIGGWLAFRGEATIGTIVAFATGIAQLNDPWGDLVNYFRDCSAAQVKYGLIANALDGGDDEAESVGASVLGGRG